MPLRVEPMTIRQLLLRDGVGGQAPALFGSWVSFDARGMCARAIVCLEAPRQHLAWRRCCSQWPSVRWSHRPIGGVIRCSGS